MNDLPWYIFWPGAIFGWIAGMWLVGQVFGFYRDPNRRD